MTRYANDYILTMIQILDENKAPVTDATVTAIVYDDDGEIYETEEMEHLANGIYYHGWQPENSGTWMVECVCGSPVVRQTFQYLIENQPARYAMHTMVPMTSNGSIVSGEWRTIFNDSGGLEILTVGTMIGNDENDEKDVQLRVTFGGNQFNVVSDNICAASYNEYYWRMGRLLGGSLAPYVFNQSSGKQVLFGWTDDWRTHSATYGEYIGAESQPLKVHSCLIEARIVDAGTNPTLQTCVNYNKLQPIDT